MRADDASRGRTDPLTDPAYAPTHALQQAAYTATAAPDTFPPPSPPPSAPGDDAATEQQPSDTADSPTPGNTGVFLLRLYIVIDREHHTRIAFDVHIDSHGTLGELRRLIHREASHHGDFDVEDPDRISFLHYPATRYGANGDIRVTSDAFLGFFASSHTTLWVHIEAAETPAEPPPATSPAPQLAVAPPQLTIAPTSPPDAGSGMSPPRIVEIEAGYGAHT